MREQLTAIPRLEKKLEGLEKVLSWTNDTISTLSRALQLKNVSETIQYEVSPVQTRTYEKK